MRSAFYFTALAALIALYAFAAIPAMQRSGARAVEAQGYHVDDIRPAFRTCLKGRQAFAWRSGSTRGKVCVGGFMRPAVKVWP